MLASLARAEALGPVPAYPHFSNAVRGLLTLGPTGCRWPLGGGAETSGFCGAPRLGRSPYCGRHRLLACEPPR